MNENDFERIKKQNLFRYFDKGSNNIWSEFLESDKNISSNDIKNITLRQFENYLMDILDDRYYIRTSNLEKLMDPSMNIDFIEDFYSNLFKGTSFKMYFDDATTIDDNLRKRYNIFTEFKEEGGRELPKMKKYTFIDKPNPCHIIKIAEDEFKRTEGEEMGNKVQFAFTNEKILGKGKAGTASLFGYYAKENPNLKIAAKLMSSNEFNLTNDGKYLPINILYFTDTVTSPKVSKFERNNRFIYPASTLEELEKIYPGFTNENIFKTNNVTYPNVTLAVPSDNFTNQTIMHLILQDILTKQGVEQYIKQFDAMLCLNTEDTFNRETGQTYWEMISKGVSDAFNQLGKTLMFKNATVDGLNFMEVANAGDLHGHLFEIQKEKFSKIRTMEDLEDPEKFTQLRDFLDEMIRQVLLPLSILKDSKYAFVHGDLKTKNVFVKKEDGNYIYKIADYDKSCINYNGVRFFNEGQTPIRLLRNIYGASEFLPKETKTHNFIDKDQGYFENIKSLNRNKTISEQIVYACNIPDQDPHDSVFVLAFEYYLQNYSNATKMNLLINALNGRDDCKFFSMNKFKKLIKNKILYILKFNGNKIKDYPDFSFENFKDNVGIITEYFRILKELKDMGIDIDLFYTLNNFLTKLSLLFSGLQNVELEQLYVRYMPTPFFPTIDLYTLFLSLCQSPMVLTFLKYSHKKYMDEQSGMGEKEDLMGEIEQKKQDIEKLKAEIGGTNAAILTTDLEMIRLQYGSLIWKCFKELWIDDDDIYTVFGYYDFLYKMPSIEDEATIGFILDPIKKNPISLLKKIPTGYWDGISIPQVDKRTSQRQVNLSLGTILMMPQICVSDCNDFSLKFHRDGRAFYVNKNEIVYSATGIFEKIKGFTQTKETIKHAIIDRYVESIQQGILNYWDDDKNRDKLVDMLGLGKLSTADLLKNYNEQIKNRMITEFNTKYQNNTHERNTLNNSIYVTKESGYFTSSYLYLMDMNYLSLPTEYGKFNKYTEDFKEIIKNLTKDDTTETLDMIFNVEAINNFIINELCKNAYIDPKIINAYKLDETKDNLKKIKEILEGNEIKEILEGNEIKEILEGNEIKEILDMNDENKGKLFINKMNDIIELEIKDIMTKCPNSPESEEIPKSAPEPEKSKSEKSLLTNVDTEEHKGKKDILKDVLICTNSIVLKILKLFKNDLSETKNDKCIELLERYFAAKKDNMNGYMRTTIHKKMETIYKMYSDEQFIKSSLYINFIEKREKDGPESREEVEAVKDLLTVAFNKYTTERQNLEQQISIKQKEYTLDNLKNEEGVKSTLNNYKEKIKTNKNNIINLYLEKHKDSFKNDLVNICKTNSYLDAFGIDINWDFCVWDNTKVEEIIKKLKFKV